MQHLNRFFEGHCEKSYYSFNHYTEDLMESTVKKSGREGTSAALFIAHFQARELISMFGVLVRVYT